MTSQATKIAVIVNMHMDTRVFYVVDFDSEVIFEMWSHWGCLETTIAMIYPVRRNMDNRGIEAADLKGEANFSQVIIIAVIARESIGPLPSCYIL